MDIKLEVKITGLEPLVEAIAQLAKGYGASNAAVDQVVSKAKAKPPVKADIVDAGKPAATAMEPATSTATQTSESVGAAAEEPVQAGKSVDTQPAEQSADSQPSATTTGQEKAAETTSATKAEGTVNTSDEALRAAAAAKARINKERTKEIVNKFASSVTAIPVEQREAFLNELETVAA